MSDVTNTVTTKYVVDNRDAIRETERLAKAQQKGARDAAIAADAFSRDATAALLKVDKSIAAQEKAWAKAVKTMEDGGGTFARALGKAEGAARGFNSVVGLINASVGNVKTAIDLGTTAVNLLGKAWRGLSDALGGSPQLRMMWEKSPHDEWIKMIEEKTKAAEKWAAAMRVAFFGADVDSPANMARRLEYRRQLQQRKDNADFLSSAKLEEQKQAVQAQYDQSAARAAANREREREAASRRGGGGARGLSASDEAKIDAFARTLVDRLNKWAAQQPGVDMTAMGILGGDFQGGAGGLGGLDWGGSRVTNPGASLLDGGATPRSYSATSGFGDLASLSVAPGSVKTPTILDRMFGNVDEFDRYTRAWSTLEDAVTSGYEALITGSESAGAAMKRVIGQSIMAEGSRMLILALREGAMAVASLATGNFASAATHGKSALLFGAGAAAAGVAASQLGVGGGATSAGATAGGGSVVAGADNTPINRTYIVGDSFGFESPRDQSRRFAGYQRRTAALEFTPRGVQYQ